jgi:hypothetical protein
MSEITFSGWKVDKRDATEIWTMLTAIQYEPHPDAITDKLEAAFKMAGNQDYRKRARDGALAYDIEKVVEKHWIPTLDAIQARMNAVPEYTEPPK